MDLRAKRRLPEDAVGSRTSVASATSESVALTTMTSAAILGVLAGTTEAAHRAQIQTTPDPEAPQEMPSPQASETAPAQATPLALEPVEPPAPAAADATPAEHSELAPLTGTPHAAQALALDARSSHGLEPGRHSGGSGVATSQSVIGSAAATTTTTASSGLLTIDGLAADVTALTTTIETSLDNLSSLLDLTTATKTITASIEQLTQTLTSTTSTVGSLLGTLPSALLGGPDAPQVDTVFQTAFAQEDVTHTALAVASQQSDTAASFLHMGDDLLPFPPVELPALNLGFMGQSYAEVIDPHDTTFSTLGHGLHG